MTTESNALIQPHSRARIGMRVPLLDLKAQLAPLREEIQAAILEVIDSTQYILGPVVERFEETVAEYVGVDYAIGVSSGTDGLLMALMALEVGPGDLVLTTDYSFFATAGTVARLGATPVFLDIDSESYNLDISAVSDWMERAESRRTRVKAIVPVHLFGQCCDMAPLMELADKYGIPLIEDAAQSLGARYSIASKDRMAGSMATMGCYSFYPSKNLGGVGDGGMVVTNDATLAEKLRTLRNHGAKADYRHSIIGGNFRLDAIQAAVLQVKFRYLDQWNRGRLQKAGYYDRNLQIKDLVKPKAPLSGNRHIYHQYVVSVPGRRDELSAFLRGAEIGHGIYYPVPFHRQECFRHLAIDPAQFPNSIQAAAQTLALPIYPELSQGMQDYVIRKLTDFYG